MFTGIIESCGAVLESCEERGGRTLSFKVPFKARLGESVAVDGACLTVSGVLKEGFTCWTSPETLARTTLGTLGPGDPVHLERALAADGRLGGHIVTGHVDGLAEVVERAERGGALLLTLRVPAELARFLVEKGSVALAGVSLTVNEVDGDRLGVSVIPFTRQLTLLDRLGPGGRANVEVDIISKQVVQVVERILGRGSSGGVTEESLRRAGFLEGLGQGRG
jgi:riboflavin synthase